MFQLAATSIKEIAATFGAAQAIAAGPNDDLYVLTILPSEFGSIIRYSHTSGIASTVASFTFQSGSSTTPIRDLGVGPDGTVFFAGDPDGAGTTFADGVYQVAANGTYTQISSTVTNLLDVGPAINVTGTVFGDVNDNGAQDTGESTLAGRTVFLDSSGTGVFATGDPSAATDANGNFFITNVPPGTYTLDAITNTGETLSTTFSSTLAAGQNATNLKVGLYSPPTGIQLSNNAIAGSTAGAAVGNLTTLGTESGATFTYTVSDTRFQVVGGQLMLMPGQSLNLAPGSTFTLSVTTTDSAGKSFKQSFTLTVIDPAQSGTVVAYSYPANSTSPTGQAQILQIDRSHNNAQTGTDLPFPRNVYGGPGANTIHSIAAGPNGVLYLAGDPDSTNSTFSDGIYKVGTTPGAFTLISSQVAQYLAVDSQGDIIALVDPNANSFSIHTGTASILRIDPTTGKSTDLADFNYTRGTYNAQFHALAAAPDGTIYFAGDPDGDASSTFADGIYKLGSTPGSFSLVSSTKAEALAVAPNGDLVAVQDNVAQNTTGKAFIVKFDHSTGSASTVGTFQYSRGLYDSTPAFQAIAVAPDNTILFAGNPNGPESTTTNAIYQLGTTAGSFTQISSAFAESLAIIPAVSVSSVSSVSSTTPAGSYTTGATINLTLNFSQPVTLSGGNLTVNLTSGGSVTIAPFTNASSATGTYTVAAGDNAAALDVTSPLVLAAGATLTDANGIAVGLGVPSGTLPASDALVIDTTAPTASITTSQVSGPSATFTFTGTDNFTPTSSLVFQTQLDNGPFVTAAGTSASYSSLTGGPHSFNVRAVDQAGNVGASVSFAWTIPVPIISPIVSPSVNDGSAVAFTVTATAPAGVTGGLTYSLATNSPAGAAIDPKTGAFTWTPSEFTGQAPGTFNITVVAAENSAPTISGMQAFTVLVGPTSTAVGSGMVNRTNVGLGLATSTEYDNNFVVIAYTKYLGRGPHANGLTFWVNLMATQGMSDAQVEAGFLASAEYIGKHGGSAGSSWITALYVNVLGRTPSAGEVQFWLNNRNAGEALPLIALGFTGSSELETKLVLADFQQYLGRSAKTGEANFWVNVFLNGGNNNAVIAGFVGSQEFFQDHGSNIVDLLFADYRAILNHGPNQTAYQYWENQL